MKIINIIQILLLTSVTSSTAQSNEPEQKPLYSVSFTFVGARSDAYWVGEREKMEVKAYDPGAAPPKNLVVATNEKSRTTGKKENRKLIRPALNIPTEHIEIKTNLCKLQKQITSEENISYNSYATIPLPERPGSYTTLVARKKKATTWEKPQYLVLSDSLDVFPEGAIRIVNLSDRTILIQLNNKLVAKLTSGKATILKKILSLKDPAKLTILYLNNDKKGIAFRRTMKFSSEDRKTIACANVPKNSKPIFATIFSTKLSKTAIGHQRAE